MKKLKKPALTPIELKRRILFILNRNLKLQKEGIAPIAIEVEGEAGIGKTDIWKQIAESTNRAFVKINLAQLQEVGDLIGLPKEVWECVKKREDGLTSKKWISEKLLRKAKVKGYVPTGKTVMNYSKPYWADVQMKKNGGILLLDDSKRAEPYFQQATMELIDRQQSIGWKLPDGWNIALTNNPSSGDYIVNDYDAAQQGRMARYEMKFDSTSWAIWAEGRVDDRCINFIIRHPEVAETSQIRMWTKFFYTIGGIDNFEREKDWITALSDGFVTTEDAEVFGTFINQRMHELPDHKELYDPKTCLKAIDKFKSVIQDRPEIGSIIQTRLLAHVIYKHETEKIPFTDKYKGLLEEVVTSGMFQEDSNYALVWTLYNYNHIKFASILVSPKLAKNLND